MSRDLWHDVLTMYRGFRLVPVVTDPVTPARLPTDRLAERIRFLQEEITELCDAAAARDLGGQADALVDLVVVALGTAAQLGLPWPELWDDVHRANCAKTRGVGKRGMLLDLIKPDGWQPPDPDRILAAFGYDPEEAAEPPIVTRGI